MLISIEHLYKDDLKEAMLKVVCDYLKENNEHMYGPIK